jgi:predicted P-loop ATPase
MSNVVSLAGTDLRFLGLLQRGANQQVLAHTANVMILLKMEPALSGMLGYNEMLGQGVLMRAPPREIDDDADAPGPYPRAWQDEDVQLILAYLQRMWSTAFKLGVLSAALGAVARQSPFHPIRNYLDGLVWDSRPRLATWLTNVFDAPNTPYIQAVGAKWLVAAVRRVRKAGCKFDYMPIFEGEQGLGKSQVIAALFGQSYFTDGMPQDVGSRDAAMALHGVWAAEFQEIDQIIRSEVETVKAFLSRGVDRYRLPYGRGFVEVARQCVLCGTSNSSDYLRDSTGNRRFWPVACEAADVSWVIVNRDQLWAEAAQWEAAGYSIWMDDADLAETTVEIQASRQTEDTWQELVALWLAERGLGLDCTTADVLSLALGVPRERHDRKVTIRCCSILKKLGWTQSVSKSGDLSRRVWRRR